MLLENTIRISVFLSIVLYLLVERPNIISKRKLSNLLNYFGWNSKLSDMAIYESVACPVFRNTKLPDIREGVSIRVTGFLRPASEKFLLSLSSSNDRRDILLILSPNLFYKYIVRSSKIEGVWSAEEILVTEACYMIAVNGYHYAKYDHRLPCNLMKCIEVKGDVEQVQATFSYVRSYPERLGEMNRDEFIRSVEAINSENDKSILPPERAEISLPFYGRLSPGGLTNGRFLKIEGSVKILPTFFFIKLQQSQDIWPQPIVAFQFNPRYSDKSCGLKSVLICNAWLDRWLGEKRFILHGDLLPMKTFSLVIVSGEHAYEVYLNSKRIVEFTYRVNPDIVNTVYIHGDIKLRSVLLGQS